jgi:transposase
LIVRQQIYRYSALPAASGFNRTRAPSLIPKKPGERVKTDRRDAIKLVRALRAGDLSAVYVPGVEDEAFRDLARAWSATKDDLKQARQRLKSFPATARCAYTGSANWGPAHQRWLSTHSFASEWQQLAFEEHRRTIEDRLAQCERLEAALREAVPNWRFYPAVLAFRRCAASSSPRRWACSPNWEICRALNTHGS